MSVEPCGDVRGFFHERLSSALEEQGLSPDENTEFYLVNLLAQFTTLKEEHALDTPMAHLMADAMKASGLDRFRRFRTLGDLALYICGFFGDHLERRGVSRGYAITVGEQAYAQAGSLSYLAGRAAEGSLAFVFEDLAERFDGYARVLDGVRETTVLRTPQEIVKLYERWRKTGSRTLAQRLEQEGVYPQAAKKGILH